MPNLHEFTATTIDGEQQMLADFKDKVCLVVNVASKCGLTPQYDGLQRLYGRLRARGLEILAFPCNQFAGQEPGTDADIVVLNARATPVMELRMERVETLAEELFLLQTLADDRAIVETYVSGKAAKSAL